MKKLNIQPQGRSQGEGEKRRRSPKFWTAIIESFIENCHERVVNYLFELANFVPQISFLAVRLLNPLF